MSAVIFPFQRQRSPIFGTIRRPVARVSLWSRRLHAWIDVVMLVDTGADYSLLPRVYARVLGVDLRADCRRLRTAGIGGTETVHLFPRLRLKLGPWTHRVPVGFLDRDDVPPLLGRMRCLEQLDLQFARYVTTVRVLRHPRATAKHSSR